MHIKAVFGGAGFNPHGAFKTDEDVQKALDILLHEGVTTIDTARLYPGSEETIGKQPQRTSFTIDTKVKGGFEPGSLKKENVLADAQDSYDRVKIPYFDILYIHAPDTSVPIAETLEAINEVYKKGLFKRFGLSNFTPQQVQEVYDMAKEKGYVLPSVYQGNYNPVARHLAGGFLTKTTAQLDEGVGRFNPQAIGGLYKNLYDKPAMREALGEWNDIAEKEGISKAELAYRWVGYNSGMKADLGDAVIFGASSLKQIEQTAQGLKKGGLSKESVKRIDEIWENVKEVAPVDNFNKNG